MLHNADGGGGCQIFRGKSITKVQCYLRYKGVGPISRKKSYVTLEWPLRPTVWGMDLTRIRS